MIVVPLMPAVGTTSSAFPLRPINLPSLYSPLGSEQKKFSLYILPSICVIGGHSDDRQVGNVADARQSFSSEPISRDGFQVFEFGQLARRKSLTYQWHVLFLLRS